MSARAIWKGVLELKEERVPVKLYSAVENRSVSFRLLDRESRSPVRQVLIEPESGEEVQHADSARGFVSGDQVVVLGEDDLESLEPESSRSMKLEAFVPETSLDHRWYDRPYFVGPDEDLQLWSALVAALGRTGRVGLTRWVMRRKEYIGALRLHRGYPVLVTLRHEDEVLPLDAGDLRDDSQLKPKELAMAQQLISMLSEDFRPETYPDEYRESVLELIEQKRKGQKVRPKKARERAPQADLSSALAASLEQGEKRA